MNLAGTLPRNCYMSYLLRLKIIHLILIMDVKPQNVFKEFEPQALLAVMLCIYKLVGQKEIKKRGVYNRISHFLLFFRRKDLCDVEFQFHLRRAF